jgi:hypothetical protein
VLEFEHEYREHLKEHESTVAKLQTDNKKLKLRYKDAKQQCQDMLRASGGSASFLKVVSMGSEPDFDRTLVKSQSQTRGGGNTDHHIIAVQGEWPAERSQTVPTATLVREMTVKDK